MSAVTALAEVALIVTADRPRVLVLGEKAVPGLVIIPAVDADACYTGGWWLAHQPVGAGAVRHRHMCALRTAGRRQADRHRLDPPSGGADLR